MVELSGIERIVGNLGGRVIPEIQRVAPTEAGVLIVGESGVGKEVVARAIHEESKRRHGNYVAVNCAALHGNLLESELFGHARGAFTGAHKSKEGRFEYANNGTIFLDEISEIDVGLQAKLLRVLQERTFERLGENESHHTNARIIAASNQNLEEAIKQGKLREDFYYRLQVFEIEIPPLRERLEDIVPLTHHFLLKYLTKERPDIGEIRVDHRDETGLTLSSMRGDISIEPKFMQALHRHPFPGNVRQLENCIYRAVIMMDGESVIKADYLPAKMLEESARHCEFSIEKLYDHLLQRHEMMEKPVNYDLLFEQALVLKGGRTDPTADLMGKSTRWVQQKRKELRDRYACEGKEIPAYLANGGGNFQLDDEMANETEPSVARVPVETMHEPKDFVAQAEISSAPPEQCISERSPVVTIPASAIEESAPAVLAETIISAGGVEGLVISQPTETELLEARIESTPEPRIERDEPIKDNNYYHRKLTDSLATKLASQGFILPGKTEIVLAENTYGPDNILKYESAAVILGKTVGALQQYVRNNGIPVHRGISAANVLKVALFDSTTSSIYDTLSLEQLASLYGAEVSFMREAEKRGLLEKDTGKKIRSPRVIRTGQKQVFYEIFDVVIEDLRNGRISYDGEASSPPAFAVNPPKRTLIPKAVEPEPQEDSEIRLEIIEVEGIEAIEYHLTYAGEGERKAIEKLVQAYQSQFDIRKLEKLVSSGTIKGNKVTIGEENYALSSLIEIESLSEIFRRSLRNAQRRYAALPEHLKGSNGHLAVNPFTALVLYSSLDHVIGPFKLDTIAQDLLLVL